MSSLKSSTGGVKRIKPRSDLTVTSIAANFKIGCPIDLKLLADGKQLMNIEYNPKKHNAMMIRRKNPYATFMLFSTGSCIVTGATSVDDVRKTIRQFLRRLQKLDYNVSYSGFTINSISGSFSLGCGINLSALSHYEGYQYNQESFAGGILAYQPGKSAMIFHTGCVTMTGCKSIKELREDYEELLFILEATKR